MANPKFGEQGKETRFKPGQSGNPGGKPTAAKNKLQSDFLYALAEDFASGGAEAISRMRTETPAAYVKAIASLMPKELEIKRPLEELTDDDLVAGIAALQRLLVAQGNAEGVGNAAELQPSGGVSTLQ